MGVPSWNVSTVTNPSGLRHDGFTCRAADNTESKHQSLSSIRRNLEEGSDGDQQDKRHAMGLAARVGTPHW
jgi:hypothetical protein